MSLLCCVLMMTRKEREAAVDRYKGWKNEELDFLYSVFVHLFPLLSCDAVPLLSTALLPATRLEYQYTGPRP